MSRWYTERMAKELIKDAENDVTEMLAEYDLSEEDQQDLAARLMNLLTDTLEYVLDNPGELAEIQAALELDKPKA